jgi:Yip1 domain
MARVFLHLKTKGFTMSMIDRIKNICLTPKTEWPVIANETTPTGALILSYALPLAAIGAIAGFVSGSIIGTTIPFIGTTLRTPILAGVGMAIFSLVLMMVGVFILSLIINALATTFGGEKNSAQALKVAVYSYTPAWVAGVFHILPWVGALLAILISLYAIYLLYTGLPVLMKNPEDKSIGYTIVVIISAIVLSIIITSVSAVIFGAGAMATSAITGGKTSQSSGVTIDPASPLGKLDDFAKKMEASSKAMEDAQKSGDQKAQAEAAAAALGTLFSGGKKVEPLPLDKLKIFVPESFAGLAKKTSSAESTGLGGLNIAKAEATYGDDTGTKSVTLEVMDGGGTAALMGLASWANVQSEKQDQDGYEKTQKIGNRMVNEKSSKRGGGSAEYTLTLGDRFVVSAKARGVDIAQLKAAVNGLDLGKLEAMKDVGVTK